ncbi:MAG TPA: tRNA (adenosine(37)-N6)-threonylcarbamoyltransferase complex dimerization subunit type 1 TsaB [Pirellulales bacterium]|jgi:tRNA threonylcarbamoyladenosine biosynthesis protein TsaB|nr:tRNA (adenosine(37)-N6)-threonylcarbamoyltransferase complex dimerization subunit type 1 TsaB [Pirellulales bacterium]
MKILAIETTDQAGSVALLDNRRVVGEHRLAPGQRSAQSLAPAIRDLLAATGWRPADIRLVAAAIGPGSFTGLRVGLTTAKTFAYAVQCDLVGVPTLEVVAVQAAGERPGARGQILAVLDAGRQQVFSARFQPLAAAMQCIEPTAILDDADWLAGLWSTASLPSRSEQIELLSGPGLRKFAGQLPAEIHLAPAEMWSPGAATVGRLALDRHQAGQRDDPWSIVPMYYRLSAAEEKLQRMKIR